MTQPASAPDPTETLKTIIKALVLQHGDPQATIPLSVISTVTQHQLQEASRLQLTIAPQRNDIDPQPFLLITVTGV